MGLIAVYIAVNDKDLKEIQQAPKDIIVDLLEDISEDCNIIDIDKIWDWLHYVLTGVSASEPIVGNELSEFIVGTETLLYEEEFVGLSVNKDVKRIIDKINQVYFDDFYKGFQPKEKHKEPYPNIYNDNRYELFAELKDNFEALKTFYNDNKDLNIFVTIY